jgi:hypothetical protein
MMMSANSHVPLADLISALRQELAKAMREGRGAEPQFELGSVELELQVEVARNVEGSAGIHFWVIALGGGANRSSRDVHTVRLTLTPVDESGQQPVRLRSGEPRRPD